MPRRKSTRNSRRRSGGSRNRPRAVANLTTNIITQRVFHQSFRFRANAALPSAQIYKRNLLNLLWISSGAAVGANCISSIRVNSVKLIAIATGGAAVELNTIAFEWNGGAFGISREIISEGSQAVPGCIRTRPPRDSAAAFWLSNSSSTPNLGDTMFTISSLTTGVTIDINVSYILMDGNENSLALTTAGATALFLYTNSLDSSNNAGAMAVSKLLPVGRVFLQAWG